MLYDNKIKEAVLGVLENRIPSIASCIESLFNEGYIPNKNKYTILDWSSILVDAYENIDVLSKEQQDKLDRVYNKVLKL